MKQWVVLSGKGGTGKTSVTASLASLWKTPGVCVDADVDAANLHILLHPENRLREAFVGGKTAVCDLESCTACKVCGELCRFDAITSGHVNRLACEGCGLCALACPQQALHLRNRVNGNWFEAQSSAGPLFYARLGAGEGNSGKLVGKLREKAREFALRNDSDWILIDGPPGTGCPTMAALTGNDAMLAVAEPSPSGLHDLVRLLDLAQNFLVKAYVCINKEDLSAEMALRIRSLCDQRGVPVVGTIPYDPAVVEGARRGLPVVKWPESAAAHALRRLARHLEQISFQDDEPNEITATE